LDYASWLDALSGEQFKELAEISLKKSLKDAFSELFQDELPEEIDCQKHRILLVAPKLDAAAERIINYLADRYSVRINAVFFKYAKLGSEEILVRSMLVSEKVRAPRKPRQEVTTAPDLERIAAERNVADLVNICRKMSGVWDEVPSGYFAGSWRYSLTTEAGWRSLLRIDVSGASMNTPTGKLDVWLKCKNVAQVTSTDEAVVRSALKAGYSVLAEKYGNYCVRLQTKAEAEKFVQQLKEWASPALQNQVATE